MDKDGGPQQQAIHAVLVAVAQASLACSDLDAETLTRRELADVRGILDKLHARLTDAWFALDNRMDAKREEMKRRLDEIQECVQKQMQQQMDKILELHTRCIEI